MGVVVFVGGAAGSGKSTFVTRLQQRMRGVYSYRRIQAFIDCARAQNLMDEQAFEVITPQQANAMFLSICERHDYVVSDVHYAIQLTRDSAFAFGEDTGNTGEAYVGTLSDQLLSGLGTAGIRICAVLITAPMATLFQRAWIRSENDLRKMRAKSLLDVESEQKAEMAEWSKIACRQDVVALSLDSDVYSTDEMIELFVEHSKNLLFI